MKEKRQVQRAKMSTGMSYIDCNTEAFLDEDFVKSLQMWTESCGSVQL